jgi:hypothetical protein
MSTDLDWLTDHRPVPGNEEHLVVDADTGIPLRATGGYPDATPTAVTTYTVERIATPTLD